MGTLRHISMEELRLGLEQLASKGVKFDVTIPKGNIYFSLSRCNVFVNQIHDDFCGEIVITKPEAGLKIAIDFDAIDFAYSEYDVFTENGRYVLKVEDYMSMSDITIRISK